MLKIKDINKTFFPGTINEKQLFKDFNLTINDGDFITVIGSNGSGKSTLLNLIAGSLCIDSGNINLNDILLSKLKEYERANYISRVFQDPLVGTCADLSISENLSLAKRRGNQRTLRKGVTEEEKNEYKTYLTQLDLGLENRIDTKVGLLSGGQRQALTLIMATLKRPELLLLDEHTAALDPRTAKKILELTDKIIQRDQLSVLMITHNMKDALNYGNRLIMMDEGKIILDLDQETKAKTSVNDLLELFERHKLDVNDEMLLNN